jgi:6,7-dimethyl-8-ribityllumazine synthase
LEGRRETAGRRFAIVVSRYNQTITGKLLEGAVQTLREAGVADEAIDVAWVPGAWEIPLVAQRLAVRGHYAAVLCLGAVIKGETSHDQHINRQVSLSLGQIALDAGIPVLFGVLTCNSLEQAIHRSGGNVGNKGAECAEAALEMAGLLAVLDGAPPPAAVEPPPPPDSAAAPTPPAPPVKGRRPGRRVRRSRARQVVLQVLYEDDLNPSEERAARDEFLVARLHADQELVAFARALLDGVRARRDELDRALAGKLEHWSLARLAATDRNVLRLGAYEILFGGTPGPVVINEAIELARRFGGQQSPAFVNGVLDRVWRESKRPEPPAGRNSTA